ncbi:MAG: DUF3102 domain-containing protein [Desulfobulbus sp.]|nr:DUF3102 domain-containing protein [Desulfobulbus sp.]
MTNKSGYAQAIVEDAEIKIYEGKQERRADLQVIDQHRVDEEDRKLALKMAVPYLDGREYDLPTLTAEINSYFASMATAYVEIGRRLLVIKKVEGHGNFTKWLETNFPASPRQAQKFMKVAARLEQDPKLRGLANGGINQALVLLDLPEDDLEEFKEDGTLYGKKLEEWQLKSNKELAAELEKERKNRDKIIAEETKGLKAENDALVKKNKELEKFVPTDDPSPEWSLSHVTEITKAVLAVVNLAEQFLCDERLKADKVTQAKIEQQLDIVRKVIRDIEITNIPF